jgi:hypothetical protein
VDTPNEYFPHKEGTERAKDAGEGFGRAARADSAVRVGEGAGLSAAHRGYIYQDVATAYFMARAVVDGSERIVVDRKEYKGDLFDDLTIHRDGKKVRRQFKSSADAEKRLTEEDLKTKTSDLRVDDLVHCFVRASEAPADEYRICSTWSTPVDEDVAKLLKLCVAEPSFEGHPTKLFRLNVDAIWPDGGDFIWKLRGEKPFRREDLVSICERLFIELECPQITLDFAAPGPLQILLTDILRDRVGVGRYPNKELRPEDAAVKLTYRASLARAQQESVKPVELLRDLGLRTDFGRITQKFPVISEEVVNREFIYRQLRELIGREKVVALVGDPGSGKSWVLTQFAEDCKTRGYVVVRHYCYLEPGDEFRERRITSDVLFGNLIAELVDAIPELRGREVPRYSAGPAELASLLAEARREDATRNVVVMVDGLDHIDRVLADASAIAPSETRIIEELSNLELPEGVCLLVGSQPGEHLSVLADDSQRVAIGGWTETETRSLAERLGTLELVAACLDHAKTDSFVSALHDRAGGNPLYTRYLCMETKKALESGDARGPIEVVEDAPPYDRDLRGYYRYLMGGDLPDPVASLLGYIDFSVTQDELAQICPEISPNIPEQIKILSPVISETTGQGGVRVYHESFRRFIVDALASHQRHREIVLEKISEWLRSTWPPDSRAYRHLLGSLLRRSCYQEILQLVGVDFVSMSLENGFPYDAIVANIGVALQAAAEAGDLPALCRLAEVRKSVDTCFREKLDFRRYTQANLAINGPQKVAEQLLFDGNPVRARDEGLIACSLCDDAGGAPPWREYLALPGPTHLGDRELAALAEFHGSARTSSIEEVVARVIEWLLGGPDSPSWYVRGILKRLAAVQDVETLRKIAETPNLPDPAKLELHLAIAQVLSDSENFEDAAKHATEAAAVAADVFDAYQCVCLGASIDSLTGYLENIEDTTRELRSLSYPNETSTDEWIAAIGFAAFVDTGRLETIRDNIVVEGWYTAWLRFAISISIAFSKAKSDSTSADLVLRALAELALEESPFRGSPRACDLYFIRDAISETWRRALSLLNTPEKLKEGLRILTQISISTTTYLQGSPGGPLTMEQLVTLVEPLLQRGPTRPPAVEVLEQQVKRVERGLYEIQAELELRLAAAYVADGKGSDARERWKRACQCLSAYSFRKDITIFELINSLPCIGVPDRATAKTCLRNLQPLVTSLDGRTDGKETKHAIVEWYVRLASTLPEQAAILLARSLACDGGVISWRLESALNSIIKLSVGARPEILLGLESTTPLATSLAEVQQSLSWMQAIFDADRVRGESHFERWIARMQAEREGIYADVLQEITRFADDNKLRLPDFELRPSVSAAQDRLDFNEGKSATVVRDVLFPQSGSLLEIASALRRLRLTRRMLPHEQQALVNGLGYRVLEFAMAGRHKDAEWLLKTFARDTYLEAKTQLLADIARGLLRNGQSELAAMTFALAGWYFRIDHVWFIEFDDVHIGFIAEGMRLDRERATRALI